MKQECKHDYHGHSFYYSKPFLKIFRKTISQPYRVCTLCDCFLIEKGMSDELLADLIYDHRKKESDLERFTK